MVNLIKAYWASLSVAQNNRPAIEEVSEINKKAICCKMASIHHQNTIHMYQV